MKSLIAVLAAALALVGWYANEQRHAVQLLEVQLTHANQRAADASDALANLRAATDLSRDAQSNVIAALRGANADQADQLGARQATADAAVARAERATREAWAAYYKQRRDMETLYDTDPEVHQWADHPLPGAVRERLREIDQAKQQRSADHPGATGAVRGHASGTSAGVADDRPAGGAAAASEGERRSAPAPPDLRDGTTPGAHPAVEHRDDAGAGAA